MEDLKQYKAPLLLGGVTAAASYFMGHYFRQNKDLESDLQTFLKHVVNFERDKGTQSTAHFQKLVRKYVLKGKSFNYLQKKYFKFDPKIHNLESYFCQAPLQNKIYCCLTCQPKFTSNTTPFGCCEDCFNPKNHQDHQIITLDIQQKDMFTSVGYCLSSYIDLVGENIKPDNIPHYLNFEKIQYIRNNIDQSFKDNFFNFYKSAILSMHKNLKEVDEFLVAYQNILSSLNKLTKQHIVFFALIGELFEQDIEIIYDINKLIDDSKLKNYFQKPKKIKMYHLLIGYGLEFLAEQTCELLIRCVFIDRSVMPEYFAFILNHLKFTVKLVSKPQSSDIINPMVELFNFMDLIMEDQSFADKITSLQNQLYSSQQIPVQSFLQKILQVYQKYGLAQMGLTMWVQKFLLFFLKKLLKYSKPLKQKILQDPFIMYMFFAYHRQFQIDHHVLADDGVLYLLQNQKKQDKQKFEEKQLYLTDDYTTDVKNFYYGQTMIQDSFIQFCDVIYYSTFSQLSRRQLIGTLIQKYKSLECNIFTKSQISYCIQAHLLTDIVLTIFNNDYDISVKNIQKFLKEHNFSTEYVKEEMKHWAFDRDVSNMEQFLQCHKEFVLGDYPSKNLEYNVSLVSQQLALALGLNGVQSVLNIFKNYQKKFSTLYLTRILNLVQAEYAIVNLAFGENSFLYNTLLFGMQDVMNKKDRDYGPDAQKFIGRVKEITTTVFEQAFRVNTGIAEEKTSEKTCQSFVNSILTKGQYLITVDEVSKLADIDYYKGDLILKKNKEVYSDLSLFIFDYNKPSTLLVNEYNQYSLENPEGMEINYLEHDFRYQQNRFDIVKQAQAQLFASREFWEKFILVYIEENANMIQDQIYFIIRIIRHLLDNVVYISKEEQNTQVFENCWYVFGNKNVQDLLFEKILVQKQKEYVVYVPEIRKMKKQIEEIKLLGEEGQLQNEQPQNLVPNEGAN